MKGRYLTPHKLHFTHQLSLLGLAPASSLRRASAREQAWVGCSAIVPHHRPSAARAPGAPSSPPYLPPGRLAAASEKALLVRELPLRPLTQLRLRPADFYIVGSRSTVFPSARQGHEQDHQSHWLRNRSTAEFLGIWERLNNPAFNPVEFDGIRMQTGPNSFVLTPKQWVEKTGAMGIRSSAGRYGGTYAHKDIAFEFASWVSVEFRLYLIKEFQRLKA